jgi:predicted nucleic acid-binding protein
MPSACFVDTNVLLYLKDPRDQKKRHQAIAWLDALAARELAVISPQVMNEFAHNVITKFPDVGVEALAENLAALRPWCLAPLNDSTALEGLLIHRRYKFSFYDSVLVASALAHGCDVLLSEDLGHGQRVETMQIVDPFRTDLNAFLAVG